jgi:general secretion pathway protein E
MLLKGASAGEIRKQAIQEGMIPLAKDGMIKVKENMTTPSEIIRNAYSR